MKEKRVEPEGLKEGRKEGMKERKEGSRVRNSFIHSLDLLKFLRHILKMFYKLYLKNIMEITYKGIEETEFFSLFGKQTHPLLVWPTPTLCLCSGLFGFFLFLLLACTVKNKKQKQKKDRKKHPASCQATYRKLSS